MIFDSRLGDRKCIKVWINNKWDKSIESLNDDTCVANQPSEAVTLVEAAIATGGASSIEVYVIEKKEPVEYDQNDKIRKHCSLIVADTSATAVLIVYDDLINDVQLSHTYIFSHIKTKKLRNDVLLATTMMSKCTISNQVFILFIKND